MPTNPDPDLMRIFDFTAADLEANRAGRMSERQIERLSIRRIRGQWFAGIGCIGVIAFAIFINSIRLSSETNDMNFYWLLLGVSGFVVIFVYLGAVDRHTDLKTKRIMKHISALYISESRGKWGERYYHLGTEPINSSISKTLYKDIQNYLLAHGLQTQFCLYYAPESRELLSIEVVD